MVALGSPVVPEVNARSAMSSLLVSTAVKSELACGSLSVRSLSSPKLTRCLRSVVFFAAVSISSKSRISHRACEIFALFIMVSSSLARNNGMVATATAPAFSTASQIIAIIGLFGPRISTLLPETRL